MTEAEWLACDDPLHLLRHRRVEPNCRKSLLLTCACLRRVMARLDENVKQWVAVAEGVADGEGTVLDLPDESCEYSLSDFASTGIGHAVMDVFMCAWEMRDGELAVGDVEWAAERRIQAAIVRDILGTPAWAAKPDPAIHAANAKAVAEAIYAERAFDRLPILADALEDAGCTDRAVLDHCRQPGEHVRGCWVVDLVLEKK